jgi:hypothetical protein
VCVIIKYKTFVLSKTVTSSFHYCFQKHIHNLKISISELKWQYNEAQISAYYIKTVNFIGEKVHACESNSRMQEPLLWTALLFKDVLFALSFHFAFQCKRLLHVHSWHNGVWYCLGSSWKTVYQTVMSSNAHVSITNSY